MAPWAVAIARSLLIEHLRSARRERLGAADTLHGAGLTRAAVPPDEELAARRMADEHPPPPRRGVGGRGVSKGRRENDEDLAEREIWRPFA
ncbi:hypothetical protein [Sorangium sp. So ce426]|uniref:hypothetical protein n=1 Tax=Sorangium sp. So ce426 TaxID=3133312 RepID=UPI003F5B0238